MLVLFFDMIDGEENRALFEQAYYEYRDRLYFIARQYLRDDLLAEDAVQEAFLHIAKSFYRTDAELCQKTLHLYVCIIRNVCIDMIRKKNRRVVICHSNRIYIQHLLACSFYSS